MLVKAELPEGRGAGKSSGVKGSVDEFVVGGPNGRGSKVDPVLIVVGKLCPATLRGRGVGFLLGGHVCVCVWRGMKWMQKKQCNEV